MITNKKTTIAIVPEAREKLGKLKELLKDRKGRFVDMDEVVGYLIDNLPEDMDDALNRQ